jgi:hypothetical protein
MSEHHGVDWKTNGVKVIPGDQLDTNTQTPGMNRAAAVNFAHIGAQIWATNKTGAHHHGALKRHLRVEGAGAGGASTSNMQVIRRFHRLCAAPGDQRLDRRDARMRAGAATTTVVVNLDIEPVSERWIDPSQQG